ncbi:hypothetical protein BJY16_005918 [Actinoplanes octamycinicus]|uniref:Uncharacterized protein n=1 Tax=Actinoplanes octamycinicus TaxID=135948 RepID=A0A7W7M9X7_9ACTN|nr:hypothetical protein [Actinoplanes octamycinicus]MBB4742459.1 hypothetical protein [Actinoplanes octamycinicus]
MGVDLGEVVAPSGVIVLAGAGFLDEWADLGEPLSVRALRAAEAGGATLRDWLAEAVAVPAGPATTGRVPRHAAPLRVTADVRPGAYGPVDDRDAIAVLTIELNVPWPDVSSGTEPVPLGDLPVDRCGMVVGDARALDSWVGFLRGERTIDGLADVRIHGKGAREARAHFDVPALPMFSAKRGDSHGWLDLPVEVARERAAAVNEWAAAQGHYRHMAGVSVHSHQYLGSRAGWRSPLGAGLIDVAGCPILFVAWSPIELQRFGGGRPSGQVYPLTLENADGGAVLRWRIPPMEAEDDL